MRSWLVTAPSLSLLLLIGLSAVPTSGRQTSRAKKTPAVEQAAWPFFAENCVSCHNAETKSGALDMETLRRPGSVARSREV
jgi:cytochrome c553